MKITENQLAALQRMCDSDGAYNCDGYRIVRYGVDVFQLELGTGTYVVPQVCGIKRDTKLPISIQSILRQLYNSWERTPSRLTDNTEQPLEL